MNYPTKLEILNSLQLQQQNKNIEKIDTHIYKKILKKHNYEHDK